MRVAPKPRVNARADVDELVDSEVPAAVVCARCGETDCGGCVQEQTLSGIVALVPWERPGVGTLTRLWATARASTFEAPLFFESMPDGPIAPALRFALLSELIAAAAMGSLALVPIALLAPGWFDHLVHQEPGAALRLAALGIPLIAVLLVLAHAAHGWALDRGARRSGARGAVTRALRFGLYAAGWDLVIGPLGAVIVAFREGLGRAASLGGLAVGLPTRSAQAFLRGCYRLEGDAAWPALRASYVAAGIATLVGSMAVIAAVVFALFG